MAFLAEEIAARINAVSYDDIPTEALAWARTAIADNIAAGLGGADAPAVDILLDTLGAAEQAGPCTVFGRDARLSVLDAAMVNGAAAHALDFDDCSPTMDGHPSVPMVPALLALAEKLDRSGRDVLEAYIIGYETETAIASVVNPAHGQRGWHPTATLGIFGAAASCAKLLGLDDAAFATALSIAASSAAGLRANSGTMTKHLHAAQTNRNGLLAALLARKSFTANRGALEHELGYFSAYAGGPVDTSAILDRLGRVYDVLKPGIAIKQYPCCAFTHPAIEAALKLRSDSGVAYDDIAKVKVQLAPTRIRNVNRPDPRNELDAKFSTHYVVGLAFHDGAVKLADFEGDAFLRPEIRALMQRVELGPHSGKASEAIVTVETRAGSTLSASAAVDMGRGPDNPMTPVEFRQKFMDCAVAVLPKAEASVVFEHLMTLDKVPSMRPLMQSLGRAARASAAPALAAAPA